MSSDFSEFSFYGNDYKYFRHVTRDRLLHEMLQSTKISNSNSNWKVLVMDKFTVKVVSSACKMADLTEQGVSLVEDIDRRRQPLPSMDAIYFIQPTKENITKFLADMSMKSPLYKRAFVFFSSPVAKELVGQIKKDARTLSRIGALREMNLEYHSVDKQGFVTDDDRALEELFVDDEGSIEGDACLNVMATRIATVLASMKELPFVRYRAAKTLDGTTMTTSRELIPTQLAARVWDRIMHYKQKIQDFPQAETCDLLILDRSIDQIAPVIHEWTYDAMCHDLLEMEGNKYVHEVPSQTDGPAEKKDTLLEEHDPIWREICHAHIADASERLHAKMTNFIAKNKAAQVRQGSRDGDDLSTRDLRRLVRDLPQYSEQIERLSLHIEIAGKINRIVRDSGLRELGKLEQDLVFGDAGMKDVIKFLTSGEDVTSDNKLRLLLILAAIYPDKFEMEKGLNLMKLARLPEDDLIAIKNIRLLGGVAVTKKSSVKGISSTFRIRKKKRAARTERKDGEETTWQLFRFYPLIEELIDKLSKGELSKDDFPCLNDPYGSLDGPSRKLSTPQSMRSRRTPTWARRRSSDDGYSSDSVLRPASCDFRMGRRIIIFIVGGATRSELRVCHKLTTKLQREVILGSSSIDDPKQFIMKLKELTTTEDISLDDIEI